MATTATCPAVTRGSTTEALIELSGVERIHLALVVTLAPVRRAVHLEPGEALRRA